MKRRKYLATLGVTSFAAIAGCSSGAEDGQNENSSPGETPTTPEPTPTTPEELEPAEFKFTEINPGEHSLGKGHSTSISATIQNIGEEIGDIDVDILFDGSTIETQSVSLDGGDQTEIEANVDTAGLELGEYSYMFQTENSKIVSNLSIVQPAKFEFTSIQPDGKTVGPDKIIEMKATVENVGGIEGSETIELRISYTGLKTYDVELEPNQERTLTNSFNTGSYASGEIEYSFQSGSDKIESKFTIESDEPTDEEIMETMDETLAIQELELVDYTFENDEIHIHYETDATSGFEILTDMEVVAGAYAGGLDQGLSTERLVAKISEPNEEPVGVYTIETEWIEQYDEGEIDMEELLEKISDTLKELG
jgi:hypothetical protein